MNRFFNTTVISDNLVVKCKNNHCLDKFEKNKNNSKIQELLAIRRTSKNLSEYNKYTEELFKISEYKEVLECICNNCMKELKTKFKEDIIYTNKYLKQHYNEYQMSLYKEFLRLYKMKLNSCHIINQIISLSMTLKIINTIITMDLFIDDWEKKPELFTRKTDLAKFKKFKNTLNKYKKNKNSVQLTKLNALFDELRKLTLFNFNIYL